MTRDQRFLLRAADGDATFFSLGNEADWFEKRLEEAIEVGLVYLARHQGVATRLGIGDRCIPFQLQIELRRQLIEHRGERLVFDGEREAAVLERAALFLLAGSSDRGGRSDGARGTVGERCAEALVIFDSVKQAELASEVARLKARCVIKDGDKADD